jgi:peptidoglycan/LPS O-acetylase OafA/YrhL
MGKKPVLNYESIIDTAARRARRRGAWFWGAMLLCFAVFILLSAAEPRSTGTIVGVLLIVLPALMFLLMAAWAPDNWLRLLSHRALELMLCYIGVASALLAAVTLIEEGAKGWKWIAFGFWLGMSIFLIVIGVHWWRKDPSVSDEAADA